MSLSEPLLQISGLKTVFFTGLGNVNAVDGIDLNIDKGQTLGIVGESGSGKTVTAYSILQLVPFPGSVVEGKIVFKSKDLLKMTVQEMRAIRGNRISMIFQEPMTSLNPVLTIGHQIMEPLIYRKKLSKKEARKEAINLLEMVGISAANQRMKEYPHQFSGGMRQRVMIATALTCKPELLIADEPTTALDVTIQAQILSLMKRLQENFGMAIMFITHDLGVIAQMVDRVLVMYAGQGIESGRVENIFDSPNHPYTIGLMQSIPKLWEHVNRFQTIEGTVPDPRQFPTGCRFHPRCEYVLPICRTEFPPLIEVECEHIVRCWAVSRKRV